MTLYMISLTPAGVFFFGNEQTFGDGTNENYFACSNPFPQQTTLLGMLRKQVLIQAGLYKEKPDDYSEADKIKMAGLIGDKSFNAESENQEFGRIRGLSPVFLKCRDKQNKDTFFRTTPKDRGLNLEFLPGQAFTDRETPGIPCLRGYKAKDGLPDSFISSNEKTCIDFHSIFQNQVKIGIDKDRSDEDEGKFFKQRFYRMEPGFSFAFFTDLDIELADQLVFMGADSSSFFMTVAKHDKLSFESLFCRKPEKTKITLLSDAFAGPSIYGDCMFAITETSDFRNIRTRSGNYKYTKEKSKSDKYTLLSRGSVLFVRDEAHKAIAVKHLEKHWLKKIGYNHYI